MSDQSRRNLLKSISVGTGAIVAGKVLPESWSRPIVESIILPAHAQTSTCMSLSLSGGSASCGDSRFFRDETYYVDDSGECPVLITGGNDIAGTGIAPDQLILQLRVSGPNPATNFDLRANFEIADDNIDPSADLMQLCPAAPASPNDSAILPFSFPFRATSGAIWTATGTTSRDDPNTALRVTVSDVLLTPPA